MGAILSKRRAKPVGGNLAQSVKQPVTPFVEPNGGGDFGGGDW